MRPTVKVEAHTFGNRFSLTNPLGVLGGYLYVCGCVCVWMREGALVCVGVLLCVCDFHLTDFITKRD